MHRAFTTPPHSLPSITNTIVSLYPTTENAHKLTVVDLDKALDTNTTNTNKAPITHPVINNINSDIHLSEFQSEAYNFNTYSSNTLSKSISHKPLHKSKAMINKHHRGTSASSLSTAVTSVYRSIYKLDELYTTKQKCKQLLTPEQQSLVRKVSYFKNRKFEDFCRMQYKNSINRFSSSALVHKYFNAKEPQHNVYCLNDVLKLSKSKPVTLSSCESLKKPKVMMKNYLNAPVCELNYMSHIQRATEMIVNTAKFAPLVHEIRSQFIIAKFEEEMKSQREKIIHAQRTLRNDEEANETRDVVCDFDVSESRLKHKIKQFLTSKGNKLNQALLKRENYFDNVENQINYLFDFYNVPHFKNNLFNYNNKADTARCLCEHNNFIDEGILVYLNIMRYKLQKEKDDTLSEDIDKEIKTKEDKTNTITIINNVNNGNCSSGNNNNNDDINIYDIENMLLSKGFGDYETIELTDDEKKKNITLYELEDFFVHKYVRYDGIGIPYGNIRNMIMSDFYRRNDNTFGASL